ncbi:MAG: twin-arginine translocation signal domain-containing protein, partial [Planctomycetes bacterium]|nr:twin-arginine translocation signal domain-containing protein [Planctomycetota bacterium]
MSHSPWDTCNFALNRRDFLQRSALGFGAMGLASLLGDASTVSAGQAASTDLSPLAPKHPHYPAKAKRVIHIFL